MHDLVWAKMPSYCAWPGRIVEPTNKLLEQRRNPLHHCILFFGSHDFAWVDEKNLKHYKEFKEKMIPLGKPKDRFKSAIDDIEAFIIDPTAFTTLFEPKTTPARKKPVKQSNTEADFDSLRESDISSSSPARTPAKLNTTPLPSVSAKRSTTRTSLTAEKVTPKSSPPSAPKRKSITAVVEDIGEPSQITTPITKKARTSSNINEPMNIDSVPVSDITMKTNDISKAIVSETLKSKDIIASRLTFGFLGLGIMGSRIVKNLIATGHDVIVWNRTMENGHELISSGIRQALSPAEVLEKADITFSCVSDPAACKEIVFGNYGIMSAEDVHEEKGYVEMTSIDAETSRELADALSGKGIRYLEAQIQGSKTQAEDGTLIILAAGDRTLFDDCQSCFKTIGKNSYFLGDVENATKMNLVLQTMAGITIAALGEAMSFADQLGLQQKDVLEVLDLTNLKSDMIMEKGMAMLKRKFTTTHMSVSTIQKDLKLAINFADTLQQSMMLAAASSEMFKDAKRLGYGQQDASAVYVKSNYSSFYNVNGSI